MIPVVSGFPCSCTSGMMYALHMAGIPMYYSGKREAAMMKADPNHNKYGYWEVGQDRYMKLGFSLTVPDKHCVKIQALGLPILAGGRSYKIILMRRDPDEIRLSYEDKYPEQDFDKEYPNWPDYYWRLMENTKSIMSQRRDCELLEVWMTDLISDPVSQFKRIAAMGIKIDVEKAAKSIDPAQHHHNGHLSIATS